VVAAALPLLGARAALAVGAAGDLELLGGDARAGRGALPGARARAGKGQQCRRVGQLVLAGPSLQTAIDIRPNVAEAL